MVKVKSNTKKKAASQEEIDEAIKDLMEANQDTEETFKKERIIAMLDNLYTARLYVVAYCLAPQTKGALNHFSKKFFMRKMKFPSSNTQSQRFNYYVGLLKDFGIGYVRKHPGHKDKKIYIKSIDNFDEELFRIAAERHQRSLQEGDAE